MHPNGTLSIDGIGSWRGTTAISQPQGANTGEGTYQCVIIVTHADNTWTFVSRKATLRLAALSRFEQQPDDQRVTRGAAVAFVCRLDAIPRAPHIDWYHNGVLLNTGGTSHTQEHLSHVSRQLFFRI
jgi:hypothetical protein